MGFFGGTKKDAEAQQACLTLGTLFSIVDTIKIYRCPVGDRNEWRTYAIVDAMNGHDGFTVAAGYNPPGIVVRKMTELKSPGSRLVFIDEGLATTESWTIYPNIVSWWDAPDAPWRRDHRCHGRWQQRILEMARSSHRRVSLKADAGALQTGTRPVTH